ncbi:helix-turn-helix domain-containing protein [Lepagella muris]|jgi:y4mF family transcriptional regulator|uniref:Transcriptional regulator n=1 Tax=Lepagella muris TaxID=3032870 RepID=A0AC61RGT1_9BACT|nr:helix-turn-helix domain-containing protein [Lepagella muris]ROT08107.1 transcriptional regulator [Muribaculaceae bacterium Isolate-037 (Harlan)]TGY78746.1 transcriptional regulator [Lepagella muris]THG52201.1 helix-turn-helix transcriptional regulator [Bacteroidales bacterium]TKC55224.1 helix-turn-helix transcriptional regulator [Bacteroidales bacterium]
MTYQEIGKIIKDRRKSFGITQPTLAALAGVGLNTLVAIERGNGNPKILTILTILNTLGLQINTTLKD